VKACRPRSSAAGANLGLSDDDIREAFEPPLSQDELRAALSTAR
jgi:hypothetical protein